MTYVHMCKEVQPYQDDAHFELQQKPKYFEFLKKLSSYGYLQHSSSICKDIAQTLPLP